MLALAAEKVDGAHPYWTTPEHTAQAREILGPDKMLCVEQKVVLSTAEARAAARQAFLMYSSSCPTTGTTGPKRSGYASSEA